MSQPRGFRPVALAMTSRTLRMSARSFSTFCMLRWVKPWPMNSQPRSSAARTIGG